MATLVVAGPCDIYASGGTPCVAAHSSTRALFDAYDGALYQVTRGSDNSTMDIKPIKAGCVADSSSQDSFCSNTTCLITIIYDQSGRNNHLAGAPPGGHAIGYEPKGFDFVASALGAPVTLNGNKAYGVFTTLATGYRIDETSGVATGNQAEGIYAVVDGTHYNTECCWDYGNAEVSNNDTGETHMEALYFGSRPGVAGGTGTGPWIMGDLENGIYAGNQSGMINPENPSQTSRFTTAIVKGMDSNYWALRGGDATAGSLNNLFGGPRPPGYYPMNKEGSIILGIGGDNSDQAVGTFYEGAMTMGYPSDDIEDQVQANIASAGYATTCLSSGAPLEIGSVITLKAVIGNESRYISHAGQDVNLTSENNSTSIPQPFTFIVRSGLQDSSCYSFETTDFRGGFLRQFNYTVAVNRIDDRDPFNLNPDATFCTEPGFAGYGTAFRSWSYPTRYLRRMGSDGLIYLGTNGGPFEGDSSDNFNEETSWIARSGL